MVITPKYDGISLLCNENDWMTYSRGGNDNEGPQTAWLRTVIDESGRTPLQGEDAIRALKESSKRLFPKITVNNERFLKRMLMWPNGKTL